MIFLMLLSISIPEIHFDKEQTVNIKKIIDYSIKSGNDPFEYLAIGYVESSFRENKVSKTKDYGVFQINCDIWWKSMQYLNRKSCISSVMNTEEGFKVASKIIKLYRKKYKHCKKELVYSCYNGGPGWSVSTHKERSLHYRHKVLKMRLFFIKNYPHLVTNKKSYIINEN